LKERVAKGFTNPRASELKPSKGRMPNERKYKTKARDSTRASNYREETQKEDQAP